MFERQTPSRLLDEQIDSVKERTQDVLEPYVGEVEPGETDYYAEAAENIGSIEDLSQFTTLNNFASSGLYDTIKEFLKNIAREQGFYQQLIYKEHPERANDSVVNLFRWLKLYASVLLEEQVEIKHEFIIENFDEFRRRMSHSSEDEPADPGREADPVLQSMLVLLWRIIEDIIDLWGRLLSLTEFERDMRLGELESLQREDGEYGFIQKLDHRKGLVRTYMQGEEGQRTKFEPSQVDFFPSTGNIVHIVHAEEPNKHSPEPIPAESITLFDP